MVSVTCNYKSRDPPLRGRYVTIRRKDYAINNDLMNFCEMAVLSCPPGRWSYNLLNFTEDCSQSCDGCNNTEETCRVSDGYCYSGCTEGWWGNYCDKQCDCSDVTCDRFVGCPTNESNSYSVFYSLLTFVNTNNNYTHIQLQSNIAQFIICCCYSPLLKDEGR